MKLSKLFMEMQLETSNNGISRAVTAKLSALQTSLCSLLTIQLNRFFRTQRLLGKCLLLAPHMVFENFQKMHYAEFFFKYFFYMYCCTLSAACHCPAQFVRFSSSFFFTNSIIPDPISVAEQTPLQSVY